MGISLLALAAIAGFGLYSQSGGASFTPIAPTNRMEGAALLSIPHLLEDFDLVDDEGRAFTPARLTGRWTLLFFGYTHCPDICPVTLQSLGDVMPLLSTGEDHEEPQVFFVSVDPENDSAERLREYVDFFHPAFVGVTGSPDEISAFALDAGAFFEVHERAEGEDPLVSHASSLFLVDPKGRLAALLDAPGEPRRFAELFARVKVMIAEASG